MALLTLTPGQNNQPSGGMWPSLAPYMIPPLAASASIIPVFRDLIAKSIQQKGLPVPLISTLEGLRGGLKAAPTIGVIVGTQIIFQNTIEKALVGNENKTNLLSMIESSVIVGIASAPILAVFNGQTMGWNVTESLRHFSVKQGLAITIQETAFVCSLSASDRLATLMKHHFGDSKAIEYTAAFTAGALGSLAGHPANTALTRWQSGMTIDSPRQLMWGAIRKARALGIFSIVYKFGKEALGLTLETSN